MDIKKYKKISPRSAFTLIELLVVIGIIAILSAVVIIALNPARQFAQARDTQRWNHINAILNAVGQNIADNKGTFSCISGALPVTSTELGTGAYNIEPCIVPTYISMMPTDPTNGIVAATHYYISYDPITRRITVSAPLSEITPTISVSR